MVSLELKVLRDWIVFKNLKDLLKTWAVVVYVRGQCGRGDENCLKDFW